MALAIEPMITRGGRHVAELDDGWTVVSVDRSRSAHFEHTVAITPEGPWVLTAREEEKNGKAGSFGTVRLALRCARRFPLPMAGPMPGDPRLRASDADRDRTAALLREHHAVGRLTGRGVRGAARQGVRRAHLGELDVLLADLPAIDLYQLPSAGIRPAPPGAVRRRGGPGLNRRGDGPQLPQRIATWLTWTAASALLLVIWLGVGIVAGGTAWLPWFLLIVIPWALTHRPASARPPLSG